MKMKRALIPVAALWILAACQPAPPAVTQLASFTEKEVSVRVTLTKDESGQPLLSASFTPASSNLHLYGKDIPRGGVEGLGRPALLELSRSSQMSARGELRESVPATQSFADMPNLYIYPPGSVTLSLPINLPAGKGWVDDEVAITYMACTEYICREPVEGKVVPIRIPQAAAFR